MTNKLGKSIIGIFKKEICPICLDELKKSKHDDCFPNGTILIKKKDYTLFKVKKDEPIVKRMLKISNNKKDESKEFIILYVNKALIGYKGDEKIKLLPGLSNEEHEKILKDYLPKNQRKKKIFKKMWEINY